MLILTLIVILTLNTINSTKHLYAVTLPSVIDCHGGQSPSFV